MKRSHQVCWLILGTAPYWLTACSSDDSSRDGIYTSVPSCVAATHEQASCQHAFDSARQQASAEAPRYSSLDSCEMDYGQNHCYSTQAAGPPVFVPILSGFLLSQHLRQGQLIGTTTTPVFRNRQGQWLRTQAGCPPESRVHDDCARDSSHATAHSATATRMTRLIPTNLPLDHPMTLSRGGFGESGSHFSAST